MFKASYGSVTPASNEVDRRKYAGAAIIRAYENMVLLRTECSLSIRVVGLASTIQYLYAYNVYVKREPLDRTISFTDRLGALTELPDDVATIIEKYHISESADMEEIVKGKKDEVEVVRLEEWVTDYCNKMIDDLNEHLKEE